MKLKNHALKAWKEGVAHGRIKPVVMRKPGEKDIPAFQAGGGPGCKRHRKAKTFARTMGRAMRRRR